MKPTLLILPFLALLIGATGMAVKSAFPDAAMVNYIGWSVAAALVALWIALDVDNFKAFFTRKGAKYGASSGLVVVLGVAVIIGIAVLSSRPRFDKTVDLTRDRLNSLSDQSLKMIANLKEAGDSVTIDGFFLEPKAEQNFRDLIALYTAKGADFRVNYVNPNTNPTRAMEEKISSNNTAIFRLGNQEMRITVFTEEKVTNALVNIMKEDTKTVYFTVGHGEGQVTGQEETGFELMSKVLESNKLVVKELNILEQAKVPEDADVVVIAGPKYDFKEEEARALDEYMKGGGSLFLMVDALSPIDRLADVVEQYGIVINDDLLLHHPDDQRSLLLGQNSAVVSEFDDFNPVTRDFAKQSMVSLILRNTRSIDVKEDNPNKMKVTVGGKTAPIMLRVENVSSPDDLKGRSLDPETMSAFGVLAIANGKPIAQATANKEKAGDTKADVATGDNGGAHSGKESRLVAIGSVQFANNAGAQETAHRDMFMNVVNYLLQDESFISIAPKDPTVSTLSMTGGSAFLVLLLVVIVYPFLFLGAGTIFWMRRRSA